MNRDDSEGLHARKCCLEDNLAHNPDPVSVLRTMVEREVIEVIEVQLILQGLDDCGRGEGEAVEDGTHVQHIEKFGRVLVQVLRC